MHNDKERYIAWAETQEDLPIFFRPWYLDLVSHYGTWDVAIASSKSGNTEGVWVWYTTKRYNRKFIVMPPLTPFGGIWIPKTTSSKAVYSIQKQTNIIRQLIGKIPSDAVLLRQTFTPEFSNWLPLYWKGFRQTTRYTFVIEDIRKWSPDDTATNVRNKIHKASGVLTLRKDIAPDTVFEQVSGIMEQKGMPLIWSKDFFLSLDKELNRRGQRLILGAADSAGNIHATAYILLDHNTAYLLMLGSDKNLRRSGAIPLIIYHAIQESGRHVNRFDFEGSVLESLFDLFSGFGGKMTPCYNIYKTKNFFWDIVYQWKMHRDTFNK